MIRTMECYFGDGKHDVIGNEYDGFFVGPFTPRVGEAIIVHMKSRISLLSCDTNQVDEIVGALQVMKIGSTLVKDLPACEVLAAAPIIFNLLEPIRHVNANSPAADDEIRRRQLLFAEQTCPTFTQDTDDHGI